MGKRLLFLICALFAVANLSAQRIAVLEFNARVGISRAEVDGISSIFNTYFTPRGYTLVERSLIDRAIDEQNFQRGNHTQEQSVRIGEILNVSKVVVGTVNIIANKYELDVRVVDVETGTIPAKGGVSWVVGSSSYREMMKNLATELADKIAINPTTAPKKEKPTPRIRTEVEVVLGYLKVYPTELGVFPAEPTSVIAQINRQHMYDYDSWRIPTVEELALLRANKYLSLETYMTTASANSSGVVLLVTDAEESYSQRLARETKERLEAEERAKIEAEKERKRQAEIEAEKKKRYLAAKKAAEERAQFIADSLAKIKAEEERIHLEKLNRYRKTYKGFGSIINIGNMMKFFNFGHAISFTYTAGYRFNNQIFLGAGVGVNLNTTEWTGSTSLRDYDYDYDYNYNGYVLNPCFVSFPIYLYFRANFINRRCSPFFALAAGGNISGKGWIKLPLYETSYSTSGIFVNPQIGVNLRMTPKSSIYIAVGFNGYTAPCIHTYTSYSAKLGHRFVPTMDFHLGFTFF